jgi:hypothetical protein
MLSSTSSLFAKPRRAVALLAGSAALAAAALTGCGGNSSDDHNGNGGNSGALTHSALIARANALCRAASAEIANIPVATSVDDLAAYAGSVQAVGERLRDAMARLTPPTADRVGFQRYLEALQTSNEQLAAMRRAASANNEGGIRTAVSRIAGAQVGLAAANAGFGLCANATPTPN